MNKLYLFLFFVIIIAGFIFSIFCSDSTSAFGNYLTGIGTILLSYSAILGVKKALTYFQSEKHKLSLEIMISSKTFVEEFSYFFTPIHLQNDKKDASFLEMVNHRIELKKEIIINFKNDWLKCEILFPKIISTKCNDIWLEYKNRLDALDDHDFYKRYEQMEKATENWKKGYYSKENKEEVNKKLEEFYNAIRNEIGEKSLANYNSINKVNEN